MPKLIKDSRVVPNPWETVGKEESIEDALARRGDHLLVPARLWLDHKEALKRTGKHLAVWFDSDQDPEMLGEEVNAFPLVALNFPAFSDGRAFSSAVILRRHCGYKGELRAIGDVQRDTLFYMKRCGFDSFDLSDNVRVEDALSAFRDFHTNYQSTVEEPLPLFRRR